MKIVQKNTICCLVFIRGNSLLLFPFSNFIVLHCNVCWLTLPCVMCSLSCGLCQMPCVLHYIAMFLLYIALCVLPYIAKCVVLPCFACCVALSCALCYIAMRCVLCCIPENRVLIVFLFLASIEFGDTF